MSLVEVPSIHAISCRKLKVVSLHRRHSPRLRASNNYGQTWRHWLADADSGVRGRYETRLHSQWRAYHQLPVLSVNDGSANKRLAACAQAAIIHGGDAMGGLTSPDGEKGFGRVLLEGTLPVRGEGDTVMFFHDQSVSLPGTTTDYSITVSSGLTSQR